MGVYEISNGLYVVNDELLDLVVILVDLYYLV